MKRIMKIISAGLVSALCFGLFTGCNSGDDTSSMSSSNNEGDGSMASTGNSSLLQFSELKDGEEIAVMTIKGFGEIKLRLFPEEAPKAVENFLTHAKEGYYDGLIFHRVINDFMIQGGDPQGTGMGGESIWGEGFETEISENLYHFKGALCMARSSAPNSQGSQFYIVQGEDKSGISKYSNDVKEKYNEIGGYPFLDGDYSVFGHVIEGLDIVDEIAQTSTDGNDKPVSDVVIESIKVEEYHK